MEPQIRLAFDAWLRGRRAQLAHKQQDCADRIGVSRITWADWENGSRAPKKIVHVNAIADWAGVEPAYVLDLLTVDNTAETAA